MRDLYYAAIDGARYLLAATVWHITNVTGIAWLMNSERAGGVFLPMLSDWAYFDDPWCVYSRWTARGYDMSFMMETGDA